MPVWEQEAMIFGSTAGDTGQAGKLLLRLRAAPPPSTVTNDDREFHAPVGSDRGYLAFPLRSKRDKQTKAVLEYKGRALFEVNDIQARPGALPSFRLEVLWRGASRLVEDVTALVVVFGNLGALGFRSRRALGALAITSPRMTLETALGRFRDGETLKRGVREIVHRPGETSAAVHRTAADCIVSAAQWLKDWRAHGRSVDHATAVAPNPPHNSGYTPYAKNDHDRGVEAGRGRGNEGDTTYRPALGLPIIQFFSRPGVPQVDWNEAWDADTARRNRNYRGEGRFASPILLRPHRDAEGKWHALVIFVDAHQWPLDPATGRPKPVFLNGKPRAVSLALYTAMKADPNLGPFR